jgi:Gnt-I system high-affinity gluconate transporter
MTLLFVFLSIALLVMLIVWAKLNPFLSFLISAIAAGFLLGLPADQVASSIQKGMGSLLGDLVIVIVTGAMLGKLVAESGAAQRIAGFLMGVFGEKYITWAMALTGLVVGIPLFYNVGFVLLVPLAFTLSYQYKLPAVYVGLPLLAALSVTHGFLPPHPSPARRRQRPAAPLRSSRKRPSRGRICRGHARVGRTDGRVRAHARPGWAASAAAPLRPVVLVR